jgi:hypothetical protein
MNKLTLSLLIVLSCLFQACDVSDTLAKGDTFSDAPYMKFSVKIVFQADATKQYKVITYNDKDISILYSILRTDTSGVLKVYNGTETTPELTTTIKHHSGETINLIQLPGQTVQLYGTEAAAADPDSNAVKVRFFYTATTLPDSVRMIVQSKKSTVTVTTYDGIDTLMIYRGTISRYVNLNLAKYWASSQTKANFYYTLHNMSTPASPLLLARRLSLLSASEVGTATNKTGPVYSYKLMTYQLNLVSSSYTNQFIFGTKWE